MEKRYFDFEYTKDGVQNVEKINVERYWEEIAKRAKENAGGVKTFFSKAGVPVLGDDVNVGDLRNLYIKDEEICKEALMFLFPELQNFGVANADGETGAASFNWSGLLSGLFTGVGAGLNPNNGAQNEIAMKNLQIQAEKEKAAESKKTLWIVLAIFAVIVVAAIIIFKKRKK